MQPNAVNGHKAVHGEGRRERVRARVRVRVRIALNFEP
jgi:hypothetical protein